MHHTGHFLELNGRFYVDGQVNFFDFCDSSEMNLGMINDMVKELGHNEELIIYYSLRVPDDCNELDFLGHDWHARNLINLVDSESIVGLFIEHVGGNSKLQSQVGSNLLFSQSQILNHEIDVGYYGDEDLLENHDAYMNEGITQAKSDSSTDIETNEGDILFSDEFQDSDFALDDMLFDENIDDEVEWTGIMHTNLTETCDQSKMSKGNMPTEYVSAGGSQFSIYNGEADLSDFEFDVGLCFKTAAEFRLAIRKYSNKQGKPLRFTKNCSDKVQVTCECGWVIYASYKSKSEKTFQVKSIKGEHTCYRSANSKHCTSRFLAQKYQQHLRSNPSWPVSSMQEIMQMENHTNLSIWKMYRTKKKAMELNNISELEQYSKLWDYCEEIRRTHPDTTIKLQCKHAIGSETSIFKRIYICWGALKKGFKAGCRPLIGLDGTHLRTQRGGVLLTAVGVDGNNSMYPFAYAMVKKECRKTWEWFVNLLIEDLEIRNSFGYTFISDKQKGLIKTIETLLPNSEHRFCLRHLYNNFKQQHKGLALKDMLWRAATATSVVDFNKTMEQLKSFDAAAFDWLKERPAVNWSKSHFSTWPKSDMLLNNLCESFNSMILKARDKPIITMLEVIRLVLMKRIHSQRDNILKCHGDLYPSIQKILEKNKKKSHEFILEWSGSDKFEVKGWQGDKMVVDLSNRTCSCKKWDLTGIPCVHAIACIFHRRERVENYVEHWYTKRTFTKAYEHLLNAVRGQEEWPKSGYMPLVPWVVPPRKVGRPLTHARRKEHDEKIIQNESGKKLKRGGSKYKCSNCQKSGHNKNGCKEPPMMDSSNQVANASRKKRFKIPVKRKSDTQKNINLQSNKNAQYGQNARSGVVTRIFNMPSSSNIVTQHSDGVSTITRIYNK